MNQIQFLAYCLQKPSAYLDYPFEPMTPVVKVGVPQQSKGRIFAQMLVLRGEPKITLRCTPESAALYRSRYPGSVVPGWHCPAVQKPHFNTVCLDGSVPDDELLRMIDHAYAVAAARLPKSVQAMLSGANVKAQDCNAQKRKKQKNS